MQISAPPQLSSPRIWICAARWDLMTSQTTHISGSSSGICSTDKASPMTTFSTGTCWSLWVIYNSCLLLSQTRPTAQAASALFVCVAGGKQGHGGRREGEEGGKRGRGTNRRWPKRSRRTRFTPRSKPFGSQQGQKRGGRSSIKPGLAWSPTVRCCSQGVLVGSSRRIFVLRYCATCYLTFWKYVELKL